MAKESLWHGKSEEELKKLDLKEFMELVPARQRRTLKRGFTDYEKTLLAKVMKGKDNIRTHCRGMTIVPQMLGKTFVVYAGKEWNQVKVTSDMLGLSLGEFSYTRKPVKHSAAGIGATRSSKAISAR